MIEFFNDYLLPALVLGSIYSLGAIGISMIYAILRFAHFAHGDLLSIGAYIALPLVAFGLHPVLAIPIAMAATAAIAIGIDRAFYRPFRKSSPITMVIASFGVALMIRAALQLLGGVDDEYYWGIQSSLESLEPFAIAAKHFYIFGAVIGLIGATHYLLAYTRTGKAMRAMSDDADLARITGIGTEKIVIWTWIIGASLAAAAGVLLGMDTRIKFDMGWNLLLPMFAAAILGGLGRPYGAIAGGMVIGILEELSAFPWFDPWLKNLLTDIFPGLVNTAVKGTWIDGWNWLHTYLTGPMIPGDYKSAVAFAVMVMVLIFRPQGIFKGRVL